MCKLSSLPWLNFVLWLYVYLRTAAGSAFNLWMMGRCCSLDLYTRNRKATLGQVHGPDHLLSLNYTTRSICGNTEPTPAHQVEVLEKSGVDYFKLKYKRHKFEDATWSLFCFKSYIPVKKEEGQEYIKT